MFSSEMYPNMKHTRFFTVQKDYYIENLNTKNTVKYNNIKLFCTGVKTGQVWTGLFYFPQHGAEGGGEGREKGGRGRDLQQCYLFVYREEDTRYPLYPRLFDIEQHM